MSEDEEVSRSKSQRLSRRTLMRLGLLAIPATQVPLGFVHEAAAQGTKLGANLIGKLEGAEPPAARQGAAYAVRSGSALADRSVPFSEVMIVRFGDPVGRVGHRPAVPKSVA